MVLFSLFGVSVFPQLYWCHYHISIIKISPVLNLCVQFIITYIVIVNAVAYKKLRLDFV